MRAEAGRPRVLIASSSVGLGHVARDLHLRRSMAWADVEWLTAGAALAFLEENGERVHPASRLLRSLGDVVGGSIIRGCAVRVRPGPLRDLISAVRRNAELLEDLVDLDSYDLVVADEFWELLMSGRGPRRGAFLTDFVDLSPRRWWAPLRPLVSRLGDAIRRRAAERFDLLVHVGAWGSAPGFWRPGQLPTDAAASEPLPPEGPVVVNVGGTRAGCRVALELSAELRARGVEHAVLGRCPGAVFTGRPGDLLRAARAVVALAGYSSLLEVSFLRRPAVVMFIRGHFEHEENASAFAGRSGYRVLRCAEGAGHASAVADALMEVLREDADPPSFVDATEEVASALRGLAGGRAPRNPLYPEGVRRARVVPSFDSMLIAVAVGAIVGLVNEYRKISGARVPMGLRTSIFISLLGYSGALLYQVSGSSAVLAVTIAAAAVVATAVYLARAAVSRSLGATTYVAMILLFFAGSLVGMGLYEYGFALSILLAALSLYKTELLGAISRIRREELLAIVNLLVISALILPMLPDRYIGPYGAFNPYEFWLTVVVVGVIFFAQYVALRVSRRGLLAFTLIGAIVSSTTVALSLVELANRRRELGTSVALNIAVSNVPMALFQVGAVLYVVGGAPALAAALPALLAGLAASAAVLAAGPGRLSPEGVEPPQAPLPIARIFEFAALLFAITAAARVVGAALPQALPTAIAASALANVLGAIYAVGTLFASGRITAAEAGYLASIALLAGAAEKVGIAALLRDGRARALAAALNVAISCAVAAALILRRGRPARPSAGSPPRASS